MLTGLVLTSILMGNITNALTTVTFSVRNIKLYGTKVAAIEGSPSYRVGIRRNAKVNPGWFAEYEVYFVYLAVVVTLYIMNIYKADLERLFFVKL